MDEKLESASLLEDLLIKLSDGTVIRIGGYHVDFLEKLQLLKPWMILDVMDMSDEDVLGVIEARKKIHSDKLINFLNKNWLDKAEGNEADLDVIIEFEFKLKLNKQQLISKLKKSDKKIGMVKIIEMNKWFMNNDDIIEKE